MEALEVTVGNDGGADGREILDEILVGTRDEDCELSERVEDDPSWRSDKLRITGEGNDDTDVELDRCGVLLLDDATTEELLTREVC